LGALSTETTEKLQRTLNDFPNRFLVAAKWVNQNGSAYDTFRDIATLYPELVLGSANSSTTWDNWRTADVFVGVPLGRGLAPAVLGV